MTTIPNVLRGENLSLQIGDATILQNVDVQLATGELLGLIGPNGAGKSSLLRILAGLQKPSSGKILLNNQDLLALDNRQRAQAIGYLPQQATAHWPLQVERLVTLGRLPHHQNWQGLQATDQQAIRNAMEQAEVTHLAKRTVTSLSGGERLRVMLARVFAGEPNIILADEPIASLDPYHQLHTMELLREHCQRGGSAVIVLHDLSLAARFCDSLYLLHQGKMINQGNAEQVLTEANLTNAYGIKTRLHELAGFSQLDIIERI
jgi:ABC-type cobalamin/Fe3+-siderophores transport system ATPase subunit